MAQKSRLIDTSNSKNFNDTKSAITSSNSFAQDFIDGQLVLTDDDEDRIPKEEMRNALLFVYPNKKLNLGQVISTMKDKGLTYEAGHRHNGVRGCFVGVKFRKDLDSDDEDSDEEEDRKDKNVEKMAKQKTELEMLKEQIKQLQSIVAGQAEMLVKRKPKKPEPESDSESEEESDEEEEEETNVIKVLTKTATKTQKCDNFFDALDFDVVCTKKKKKEKSIQMST